MVTLPRHRHSFALTAIGVGLVSFALTMLLLSASYVKDLALLTEAPVLLWSALCGQPSADPLTLPLLVTMSALALLVGLMMIVVGVLRARRQKMNK